MDPARAAIKQAKSLEELSAKIDMLIERFDRFEAKLDAAQPSVELTAETIEAPAVDLVALAETVARLEAKLDQVIQQQQPAKAEALTKGKK